MVALLASLALLSALGPGCNEDTNCECQERVCKEDLGSKADWTTDFCEENGCPYCACAEP